MAILVVRESQHEGMAMNRIAEELDAKLRTLDDIRAERLARMVRDAMTAIESPTKIDANLGVENGWPVGYFTNTVGMFVDERFERPEQGVAEERKKW